MKKNIIVLVGITTMVLSVISTAFSLSQPTSQEKKSHEPPHEYNNEILFREVPWGIDYYSVTKAIPDIKFQRNDYQTNLSLHYLENWYFPELDIQTSGLSLIYRDNNSNTKVAGYNTEKIFLYFALKPNEKGKIEWKNDLLTSFFGAEYFIKTNGLDLERAETDIVTKISSIYGEPNTINLNTDWMDDKRDRYVWKGTNDTYIFLLIYYDHSGDSSKGAIYLDYIWGKGDELLKATYETIESTKQKPAATKAPYETDSTEGL